MCSMQKKKKKSSNNLLVIHLPHKQLLSTTDTIFFASLTIKAGIPTHGTSLPPEPASSVLAFAARSVFDGNPVTKLTSAPASLLPPPFLTAKQFCCSLPTCLYS